METSEGILEAVRRMVAEQEKAHYPCTNCKHGGTCTYNHKCTPWVAWFVGEWRSIRKKFNKEG